jgi:lytic murein transglycosylase
MLSQTARVSARQTLRLGRRVWLFIIIITVARIAEAAETQCGGPFSAWLVGLRTEAASGGLSGGTIRLLDRVRENERVLALDRSQRVFGQDWLTFSRRMVNDYRLKLGRTHLGRYAKTFRRADDRFGVPGPVIAAFWGLETDYGANQGNFNTLDALSTLAHDCRRSDLFRPQLLDSLRLVDKGYLEPSELVGAWAGELGQIQLLPSDYLAFATDGDGNGRVDLRKSKPDVIMTGGQVLAHIGWRRGEPWLEEVRLPDHLPWDQAGAYGRLPSSQWATWGVHRATGGELPGSELPAALLLPMGRRGPAFLAYPNYDVFLKWNQSLVYATTAAYFATRLAGAPEVDVGRPEAGLSFAQMKVLQSKLAARGYDVGEIDGVLGARTRDAVRMEQLRLGMPADAWPTPALLSHL